MRTLGCSCPSSRVVLTSGHLEYPGDASTDWQKDLHGCRETAWQVEVPGIELGERKAALLWRGGSPFHRETKVKRKREGLRE